MWGFQETGGRGQRLMVGHIGGDLDRVPVRASILNAGQPLHKPLADAAQKMMIVRRLRRITGPWRTTPTLPQRCGTVDHLVPVAGQRGL